VLREPRSVRFASGDWAELRPLLDGPAAEVRGCVGLGLGLGLGLLGLGLGLGWGWLGLGLGLGWGWLGLGLLDGPAAERREARTLTLALT